MFTTPQIMTQAGNGLLFQAILGHTLTFTRMAIGSGELPEGQDPSALTGLIDEELSITLTGVRATGQNTLAISGAFRNTDIEEAFMWREAGLYAKGEDNVEVLYCYANAGEDAEMLDPAVTGVTIDQTLTIDVSVGDAANVEFANEVHAYVTLQVLQDGLAGKVSKSGDTMTGDLNTSGSVHTGKGAYIDSGYDYDTPPSEAVFQTLVAILDAQSVNRGQIYAMRNANGSYYTMLQARDGQSVNSVIGAGIDQNGNPAYYLSSPVAMLEAVGVRWIKVTGETSATGTIGLGLAKNRYMVTGIWADTTGTSYIVTPFVSQGGTNWSALVETVGHAAVTSTSVTLYVGFIDFGAGNIS